MVWYIQHETPIHNGHFKKEIRSPDPRVPILWPSENLRQKRRDRYFRLPTIFLIFFFLDPNFAKGHKIGTLGSIDLIIFLNDHHEQEV